MTLTEFLLARIADDEALADRSVQVGSKGARAALVSFCTPDAAPVLLLHPKRVLAECESKRRIVEDARNLFALNTPPNATNSEVVWAMEDVLENLAAVYADHPDYRPEWKP